MIWVFSLFISAPSTKTKFWFSVRSTTSRFLHPAKGFPSKEMTDLGILIEENLHSANASFPITLTEFGNWADVRFKHELNAWLQTDLTPSASTANLKSSRRQYHGALSPSALLMEQRTVSSLVIGFNTHWVRPIGYSISSSSQLPKRESVLSVIGFETQKGNLFSETISTVTKCVLILKFRLIVGDVR